MYDQLGVFQPVITSPLLEKQRELVFELKNLEALINNTHDYMWSLDTDYTLIAFNDSFGKLVEQLSGRPVHKGSNALTTGFTPELLGKYKTYYDRVFNGETFTEEEYTSEPFENWSSISFHPIYNNGAIAGVACHAHNITANKLAERRVIHINRLYSFISEINKAITHSDAEQELFSKACDIAVEHGNFKVAWIGMIDKEHRTIELKSQCGFSQYDAKQFACVHYEDHGPTQNILNSDGYYICNDIAQHMEIPNWKPFAASHGFRSCMVLPVRRLGEIIGTFNLYAEETDYFNAEEIALLEKVTEDISYALDMFENENQRMLAEQRLKHNKLRMKQAQALAHFGSWDLDFETGVACWSEEACNIYGIDPADDIQSFKSWLSFIHPDDQDYVKETTKESERTLSNASFYHRILRHDGTVRHLHTFANFEFNTEGIPVGLYGVAHDITDQLANITRIKAQNQQLIDIAWLQSHKVRAPLANILGLAQLFKTSEQEHKEEIVNGILTSSEKLDDVIREIVNKTSVSDINDPLREIIEG